MLTRFVAVERATRDVAAFAVDLTLRRRRSPAPCSLARILEVACRVAQDASVSPAFVGSPAAKSAPDGLGYIMSQRRTTSLGIAGGLTLIKSAAAFSIPQFRTTTTSVRRGTTVEHYAQVQQTTSRDATHDSYYPGPGDHRRPGMTQKIDGKTFTHYWRISPTLSQLIRRGEEEHLADAKRAYDLTYRLIADTINALAKQKFGPARTPSDATKMAEAELARRLPRALGTNPSNWVAVLNRLLDATKLRDTQGWHAVSADPPRTVADRIIHPVATTPSTKVGRVPSAQIVNY